MLGLVCIVVLISLLSSSRGGRESLKLIDRRRGEERQSWVFIKSSKVSDRIIRISTRFKLRTPGKRELERADKGKREDVAGRDRRPSS
ncbi:hypothetical protein L6452_15009 [Arctium lappa]|uniref:Uncharacterized protein n=1 Tax=Arctium lappa TaxID=4217 RepID=A0ACB9CMF8_ARCLA|nr:hypothetical protein L6452_15009 [Arctium lappa]